MHERKKKVEPDEKSPDKIFHGERVQYDDIDDLINKSIEDRKKEGKSN